MDRGMEYQNAREYHAGLLQDAEKRRLARHVFEGRQKYQKVWCNGLSWLGTRLSAWGEYLQTRYRFSVQAPTTVRGHSD